MSQNSYTPSSAQSAASASRTHLADQQAHVGDDDLVQRLEGVVELVGPYLEAPGVGGNRGDLAAVQPAGGGERQAGVRGRPRSRPSRPAWARARCPGADEHDVAAADGHPVGLGGPGEVGDGEPVGQLAVRADDQAHVEQHATAGDYGAMCSMPVTRSPSEVTTFSAARPFHALPWSKMCPRPSHWVEHQRHRDHVVRAADAVREALVAECAASVPVSSMVCTGLFSRQPFCGPFMSNRCASEQALRRGARATRPRAACPRRGSSTCRARRPHPTPPVGVRLGGLGYRALRVAAVQAHAVPSATQRVRCTPRPVMEPSMTSPSRSSRPWMPLPAGLPVNTRSPDRS